MFNIVSILYSSIKRLFTNVLDGQVALFQFYIVRLKDLTLFTNVLAGFVSILYSSIKSS